MTYANIIAEIKSRLLAITEIQEVYAHPLGKDDRIKAYPSVVFMPNTVDSSFSDTSSNFRVYNFKMWVTVNSGNASQTKIFETALPKAVDAVLEHFDTGWDFGTLNGRRAWTQVTSGVWGITQEEKSVEAYAELNLQISLSVDA